MNEQSLLEKLRKIEALIANPGTAGEGMAAAEARQRLLDRLRDAQALDPPTECSFSMPDTWAQRLFFAILKRYNLKPYRYRGQRRTTVIVRAPRRFIDETLWPEFIEMHKTLRTYLNEVTDRVIVEVLQQKPQDDAEEIVQGLLGTDPSGRDKRP